MSYYTQLSLTWNDADYSRGELTADDIVEAARGFVAESNWSEHVLIDLREACGASDVLGAPGFNKVRADGVIELVAQASSKLPGVIMYAKGSGEEFGDMWMRKFLNGEALVAIGPFDPDESTLSSWLPEADSHPAVPATAKSPQGTQAWWMRFMRK